MTVRHTADGVPFVRTPDENFVDLADYPFAPQFMEFQGLRLHYIDEGPKDGPVALLMHGMPTWSFLNRHIVRVLSARGFRCIAADHIGFGKSDKVTDDSWYSIARHSAAHRALIAHLDLREIVLFCQDWGGPIGLAQVAESPDRFSRLVIMNTWLHHDSFVYTPTIRQWNAMWKPEGFFGAGIPEKLAIGDIMMIALGAVAQDAIAKKFMTGADFSVAPRFESIRAGYNAPFAGLDAAGHAAARRFPLSIPFDNPSGGNAAAQAAHFEALLTWRKPVHFIWGGADEVFTTAWGRNWAGRFPHASFDLLPDAGHFLQESHGARIAEIFLQYAR